MENPDGSLPCPESLAVRLCGRHRGVCVDGLTLLEHSACADIKMRMFNQDGTEGCRAGNCLRYGAKYLYDNNLCRKDEITAETAGGLKKPRSTCATGRSARFAWRWAGPAYAPADLPALLPGAQAVDVPIAGSGQECRVSCVSVGNPHCVVLCGRVDGIDLKKIGPQFEHPPLFPQRVNTAFVRVINPVTLKMRAWERENAETVFFGTAEY